MMDLLLLWIGAGILFLILELITSAFYGFSLAISAFAVAVYVFVTKSTNIDIVQGGIFLFIALIMSYLLPRWLTPHDDSDMPQGLDKYLGESHRVRLVGEDFKIRLDGVQYIVLSEDEIIDRDLVHIVDRRGSVFIVEKM